ncbi:MAG: hypothetical protein HOV96_11935 [Nonomuraea sp.]|nr:hypothetical protein [Nonomuraea sp.]
MEITRVGLGSWAVAGSGWRFGWGATHDAESVATIRHAVARGVNWIDTAAVYGLGHAEELVGKAVADLPEADRPYLFTKAGLVWNPDDPQAAPRRIMKPASVRRELEDSLRRLDVDRIDLYQVHHPDTGESLEYAGDGFGAVSPDATPLEEYWQVMADLRAEGEVRAIGLSNHSPGQPAAAERVAGPGITGAIVGARRPVQVDDWVAAGSVELTRAELDEIATAITGSGAGTGPARP